MDAADIAILETYDAVLSPVERDLLAEVRRLHEVEACEGLPDKVIELEQELDGVRDELREAKEEVEEMTRKLEAAEGQEKDSEYARGIAERSLEELKTTIRGLLT